MEWRVLSQSQSRLQNIPAKPDRVYSNDGWKNMGDWIGTGFISTKQREYLDFESARKYVRLLKLKNTDEWRNYCKSILRPLEIPSNPHTIYKNNGWKSLGDWIGSGSIASKDSNYYSFEQSREFIRALNLKNQIEWRNYRKSDLRPNYIPSNPNVVYKNKGWVSLGDWLGNSNQANHLKIYIDFNKAREFARSLKLNNQKEWQIYARSDDKPKDIPSSPEKVFSNEFGGYGDWLGTMSISNIKKEFLDYESAKLIVSKLNLSSAKEFRKFYKDKKIPLNIPSSPERTYKDKGWKDWVDFLAKERLK
jgi:hypothetical protein